MTGRPLTPLTRRATPTTTPGVTPAARGVVGVRDFTHAPAQRCEATRIANGVAVLLDEHSGLESGAHIIWNRPTLSADRTGKEWRAHSGSNGHSTCP
ncbi:hypothetical protein NOCARDAX2BIS_80042 [Nocardioides sp. AX2bis]|nr:hypothetical protein NOCARDAX2BIS_80042 [Nocardioides sp. AX2bis]